MTYLNVQIINPDDLKDRAMDANKKINFNLTQLNKNAELLPDDVNKADSENISELFYFRQVYECISRNSKLIGFNYPKLEINFAFSVHTKDKIYEPINKYFKSLIKA